MYCAQIAAPIDFLAGLVQRLTLLLRDGAGETLGICISAAAISLRTFLRAPISRLQAGYAFCAASIAWSSSALVQSGTWAKTLPVAGLITPTVFDPFTALPSIVIVNSGI